MRDVPDAPAIVAEGLVKRYGAVTAVDQVGFDARPGTVLGLLGGNGAGKTTTIAMLLGLLIPDGGRITVLGHDMATDRFAALARMNFSSPYVALPHRLSVRENLTVYGHLYGVAGLRTRIDHLAGELDLGGFLDRPAGQLSAGQKTRVALAKALINTPAVLLLDEPTASLDLSHQLDALELLKSLAARGTAVVAAIHDLSLAARFCDRLVLLSAGRVVADGSPETVLTPERVGAVFGLRVSIRRDPESGFPVVIPIETIGTLAATGGTQ
jgi:ABC-2 type transport system ATP-binding protein